MKQRNSEFIKIMDLNFNTQNTNINRIIHSKLISLERELNLMDFEAFHYIVPFSILNINSGGKKC
jgi:hypothetical protein